METKPFSLQSPEQIAKDYGGNKQKIAQAMQMGIIDPTAGTLAGMFIDRMRAAAQQEVVPQQTVAQQTFAPPAPPAPPMPPAPSPGGAGLGAIAPSGAPPAPAPMGGPPPMEPPSPMGPPPSMASGGIVGLPLPDSMFDEPSNGGYAGGGIVAFAEAGEVKKTPKSYADRMLGGMSTDLGENIAQVRENIPLQDKYSRRYTEALEQDMSPEAMAARKKQDMWMTLAQIGAKMATTPGGFLRGAAAGIESALPGAQEMAKERRTEQREALKGLVGQENVSNQQAAKFYELGAAQQQKALELRNEGFKLDVSIQLAELSRATEIQKANIMAAAQRDSASIGAAAANNAAYAELAKIDAETRKHVRTILQSNPDYRTAVMSGDNATVASMENTAYQALNLQPMSMDTRGVRQPAAAPAAPAAPAGNRPPIDDFNR